MWNSVRLRCPAIPILFSRIPQESVVEYVGRSSTALFGFVGYIALQPTGLLSHVAK